MVTKRLPRQFWKSTKAHQVMEKYLNHDISATEAARELGTTEAAVYNAKSRFTRDGMTALSSGSDADIQTIVRQHWEAVEKSVRIYIKSLEQSNARLRQQVGETSKVKLPEHLVKR